MAVKPVVTIPEWTDGAAAKVVEPSAPLKLSGWVAEKPPFQIWNWLQYATGKWLTYCDTVIDEILIAAGLLDGRVSTAEGVISTNTDKLATIASGSYTPTVDGGAAGALNRAAVANYIKIGNIVHVTGGFHWVYDAARFEAEATVSLPFAPNNDWGSSLLQEDSVCGVTITRPSGSIPGATGRISGKTGTKLANLSMWRGGSATVWMFQFSFSYPINN